MGNIIIQEETTKNPISMIGKYAGVCYNSDIEDNTKNYQRGLDCLQSNHGRTLEFVQVYLILDNYSARTIRQLYTHIGGMPTRLQASTRYIKYGNFDYVIPPSVKKDRATEEKYVSLMNQISKTYEEMMVLSDVPKEDLAMILPLGMVTKVVIRTNFRQLVDMAHQRMCNRAYWEFRDLMKDLASALSDYSEEWNTLVRYCFHPKCVELGYCPEKKSCGRISAS